MKKYRTFLPVAVALLLFLLSQFFIVRQIWKQKDEVFRIKYYTGSQEAMDKMSNDKRGSGFDYAYWMVDYHSKSLMKSTMSLVLS